MNNFRNTYITSAFLLTAFITMAQKDTSIYIPGVHEIKLECSFDMNSSSLTNNFIYAFYQGGFLSRETRTDMSNKLNETNTGGYFLDGSLIYTFTPENKKKEWGYYVGIDHHSYAGISFKKDLFDLIFFGNEDYIEDTLEFSNMSLDMTNWQELKMGISKCFERPQASHTFGFGIGFVNGQKTMNIEIGDAWLYTHENGEYLTLQAETDIRGTNRQVLFPSLSGTGYSLNLSYKFTDNKNDEFIIDINDIGSIYWDHRGTPEHFNNDTVITFEGLEVDFNNIEQTMLSDSTIDTMLIAIFGYGWIDTYETMLPTDIRISHTHTFKGDRFILTTELKHRLHSLYKPRITLKPSYKWSCKKSKVLGELLLSYGGFGKFNAGLGIEAEIGKKLKVAAGCNTLNSVIISNNSCGLGVTLSVNKTF